MLGDKAAPSPNQANPGNPTRVELPSSLPHGFYKSIVLDVLAVLSALGFGYGYYHYLTQGMPVWILLIALTVFAVFTALQAFLAEQGGRTLFVIVLESLALIGPFWQDDWRILAITGVVVLVFLSWGYLAARSRLYNSIEIPFFGVAGTTLAKFTTSLLIFMVLIYVPQIGGNPLVVSQQSFRTFFDWASGFVTDFYPNLSLNSSFGNFSESFAKMELANNPEFKNLTSAQQGVALQQATQQIQTSLTAKAPSSSPVASSSPTSDAFYDILQGMMQAWQSQSGGWFDVGWAAVIFITLRGVGIIFIWFAEFISLLFYEFLLAIGFIKVGEETRTRETIGY
jgi:hypothetical protein